MGFANGQRIKRKADGLTVEIKEVGVTQITCCCDGSEELLTIPYSSLQNREWKVIPAKPERLVADAKDLEKWKFLSQTSLLKASVMQKLWEGAPCDPWSGMMVFSQPKSIVAKQEFQVGCLECKALTNKIEMKDGDFKGGIEIGKALGFQVFLLPPPFMLPFWFMKRSSSRDECNMELVAAHCSKQNLTNLTSVKFPSAKNFRKVKVDDPLVLYLPEKKVDPAPLEPVVKRQRKK